MKLLKSIAITFFNFLDKYIHQIKILRELKKTNRNVSTFIDVGSHKGTYTDLILKEFLVKKVLMFEPQKNIFMTIKKKYKKIKNVKIFNYGISKKNGSQIIYINKHDLTSSLNKLNKKNTYLNLKARLFSSNIDGMIRNSYKIKTLRLDGLIKKEKIKSVDLLKIDTEGHEYEVLLGLGQKIKAINIILIEIHNDKIYLDYSKNKIHNYLIKNNFILKKKLKFPFTEWEDRIYVQNN